MAAHITHLDVSLNEAEEQNLLSQRFKKIDVNLNKGAPGNFVYLWYKKESGQPAITRLQFTFNDRMADGLISAGYAKIDKNINAGTGGDHIYLWCFRGQTEFDAAIVDIEVTTEATDEGQKFGFGWERQGCDLTRRAGGDWVHAWVQRDKSTYIRDVTATDSYGSDADLLMNGYLRVAEDTNRGAGGAAVFIWYRLTTDNKLALQDLQISTNRDQYQTLQQQKYTHVNVNLNEGTKGDPVYLWHKKEAYKAPIQALTVLFNPEAVESYENAGVEVVKRDLNTGNLGRIAYLSFYQ